MSSEAILSELQSGSEGSFRSVQGCLGLGKTNRKREEAGLGLGEAAGLSVALL